MVIALRKRVSHAERGHEIVDARLYLMIVGEEGQGGWERVANRGAAFISAR